MNPSPKIKQVLNSGQLLNVLTLPIFCRIFEEIEENSFKMITDIQLAMFSNLMGIMLFLLVVLYHFISANNK